MNDYLTNRPSDIQINIERMEYTSGTNSIITKLKEKKLIVKENNELIVDEQFKNELLEFNYFIDIQQ